MKRSAPTNRSREYIKKIKQARLKLSESSTSKANEEVDEDDDDVGEDPKTPPKETVKEKTNDENEEDFLDVANDVNFEEDEEWSTTKNSSAAKSEDGSKIKDTKNEDEDKTPSEQMNVSGTSQSDERPSKRERSEKSASPIEHSSTNSLDLNCIHCRAECRSVQVSLKAQLLEAHSIITMTFNRTIYNI